MELANVRQLYFSRILAFFEYPKIAVERSMVALLAWGEYFCGEPLAVESACFSFDAPEHRSLYEDLFGKNLNFGATENRIVLGQDILARPVRSANRYVRQLLAKRSTRVLSSSDSVLSLKYQVESLLRQNLQKYSRLERATDKLNISRTNLYRKLKAENTQYSALLLEARLTRLDDFEARTLSSEDKALQLGFSDVSSYYRFLKRVDRLT
jgi:Arabinose-binding domain of AraC transcription regulator, N-term